MIEVLLDTLRNRDGVWWFDVPKPFRIHRHVAWTTCATNQGYEVHRCACGATRYSDVPGWIEERRPRVWP